MDQQAEKLREIRNHEMAKNLSPITHRTKEPSPHCTAPTNLMLGSETSLLLHQASAALSTPNLMPLLITEKQLEMSSRLFIPTLESPVPQDDCDHSRIYERLSMPLPLMFQDRATGEAPLDGNGVESLFSSLPMKRGKQFVLRPCGHGKSLRSGDQDRSFFILPAEEGSVVLEAWDAEEPSSKRLRPCSFVSLERDVLQCRASGGTCGSVSKQSIASAKVKNSSELSDSAVDIDEDCRRQDELDVNRISFDSSELRDRNLHRTAHGGSHKRADSQSTLIAFPRVFRPTIRRSNAVTPATANGTGKLRAKRTFAPSQGSAFSSSPGMEQRLRMAIPSS